MKSQTRDRSSSVLVLVSILLLLPGIVASPIIMPTVSRNHASYTQPRDIAMEQYSIDYRPPGTGNNQLIFRTNKLKAKSKHSFDDLNVEMESRHNSVLLPSILYPSFSSHVIMSSSSQRISTESLSQHTTSGPETLNSFVANRNLKKAFYSNKVLRLRKRNSDKMANRTPKNISIISNFKFKNISSVINIMTIIPTEVIPSDAVSPSITNHEPVTENMDESVADKSTIHISPSNSYASSTSNIILPSSCTWLLTSEEVSLLTSMVLDNENGTTLLDDANCSFVLRNMSGSVNESDSNDSKVDVYASLDAPAALGIAFGVLAVIGVTAFLSVLFVCRLRYHKHKTPATDRPSLWSDNDMTLSYINANMDYPKDMDADMSSLDDDSFLNSLDSYTFANLWTREEQRQRDLYPEQQQQQQQQQQQPQQNGQVK